MMHHAFRFSRNLLIGSVAVLSLGCGSSEFVEVTGHITLDGEPLENATVVFSPNPTSTGTTAYAKTDSEGSYQMAISDTQSGMLPGTFRVEIRTADEDADEQGRLIRIPERVPPQYNSRTTLTDIVVSEDKAQSFDFALETAGNNTQRRPAR